MRSTVRTHSPAHAERRRAQGRERARRWRERHAATVYALEAAASVSAVDAAIVTALIEEHLRLRGETGDRDVALPLRGVIRLAREILTEDGMEAVDARVAVHARLQAGAQTLQGDAGHAAAPGLAVAA